MQANYAIIRGHENYDEGYPITRVHVWNITLNRARYLVNGIIPSTQKLPNFALWLDIRQTSESENVVLHPTCIHVFWPYFGPHQYSVNQF